MWEFMAVLAQGDEGRYAAVGVLMLIGGICVVVWIISFAIRSAEKHQQHHPPQTTLPPIAGHAFPVQAIEDGPGKFRVVGVDRDSGMDVTDHIDAASAANAKVKAELRGIVVTRVERA
jgi:hypothetical protein